LDLWNISDVFSVQLTFFVTGDLSKIQYHNNTVLLNKKIHDSMMSNITALKQYYMLFVGPTLMLISLFHHKYFHLVKNKHPTGDYKKIVTDTMIHETISTAASR